jgi:hypothetical protein
MRLYPPVHGEGGSSMKPARRRRPSPACSTGCERPEEMGRERMAQRVTLDGQRREEAGDLGRAHRGRVALAVEEDVAADPRRRSRHPDRPGALGAPRREHDHDLYARPEPRPGGRPEPRRSDVPSVIRPAAFTPKSAKIRSVLAQPIQTSPVRASRAEGVGSKGRKTENPRCVRCRDRLQSLAAFAVLCRPAYPAAEF